MLNSRLFMFKILETIQKTSPSCFHFIEESTEAKRLGNLPKVIRLLRDRGTMPT